MDAVNDNLVKFNGLLVNILGVSEGLIVDELCPDAVESWDSFNGLLIASELESTFNVSFTTEEIVGVVNVGDMKNVLRKHGIQI